jgi:3-oxoacyl-[acyl-carrier protein] reductase
VTFVAADVTTDAGREAVLAACPAPDILINNAGGPPTGDFRSWGREEWIKALDANMLASIFFIKATLDGMIERRWGRIVNITSIMVKQPAAILGLSNGARAGLTGFVGGLARDVARHGVTINSVLPGQFDTDRLRSNQQRAADASGSDLATIQANARRGIPTGRFGTPEEFGAMCAFLCSQQAAFITGQNILLDGGQFPGLL